jgi:sodium/hydrogen exchanger-like protein 6/7
VDPLLNGLVLGESLLNDAVAIVLCSSIEEYAKASLTTRAGGFEATTVLLAIVKFFTVFLGSVGLGAGVGCATAILTKFTRLREAPLLETSIFFLMSYSSYLIAEIAQMSGIVAVLFCGVFQVGLDPYRTVLESLKRHLFVPFEFSRHCRDPDI